MLFLTDLQGSNNSLYFLFTLAKPCSCILLATRNNHTVPNGRIYDSVGYRFMLPIVYHNKTSDIFNAMIRIVQLIIYINQLN